MSNLVNHAQRELELASLFRKDSDYGGMLGEAVLKLIKVFSRQGHSGFSANMAISIFERLAKFEPLTPLTGEANEWEDVGDDTQQNRRCSHVFKRNGQAYDISGRVFRDPEGYTYTSSDSQVLVNFPYTPKTEYVSAPPELGKERNEKKMRNMWYNSNTP